MKNPKIMNRDYADFLRKKKRVPMVWVAVRFLLAAFGAQSVPVLAGSVSGPNVVWVNLDLTIEGQRSNQIVRDFASSRSTDCNGNWSTQSLLYMVKRPPLIDDNLIRDVFLKGDISRKKRLHYLLRNYKDPEAYDGFDGVMVYARNGEEVKIMSLTTGRSKISTYTAAINHRPPKPESIKDAFCALLPPITRAP